MPSEPAAGQTGPATAARPAAEPAEMRYVVNAQPHFTLIKSTIAPDSWDDNGGTGSLNFFAPSLDFVLSATEEVHDGIDALFARLRELPPKGAEANGGRLAEVQLTPYTGRVTFQPLMTLIKSNIRPTLGTTMAARDRCSRTSTTPRWSFRRHKTAMTWSRAC